MHGLHGQVCYGQGYSHIRHPPLTDARDQLIRRLTHQTTSAQKLICCKHHSLFLNFGNICLCCVQLRPRNEKKLAYGFNWNRDRIKKFNNNYFFVDIINLKMLMSSKCAEKFRVFFNFRVSWNKSNYLLAFEKSRAFQNRTARNLLLALSGSFYH